MKDILSSGVCYVFKKKIVTRGPRDHLVHFSTRMYRLHQNPQQQCPYLAHNASLSPTLNEHPEKAESPICVTESGIVTDASDEHH